MSFFRSCRSSWPCLAGWGSCLGFCRFVGRVLFSWVLWSMLSGPRHLLSALALGISVGPLLWIRRSCLSFVCLLCSPSWRFPCFFCFAPSFGFVISLGLFRPVGSAGVGGIAGGLGATPRRLYRCSCCGGSSLLSCSFFCYSWPLGHREASKRVVLELA